MSITEVHILDNFIQKRKKILENLRKTNLNIKYSLSLLKRDICKKIKIIAKVYEKKTGGKFPPYTLYLNNYIEYNGNLDDTGYVWYNIKSKYINITLCGKKGLLPIIKYKLNNKKYIDICNEDNFDNSLFPKEWLLMPDEKLEKNLMNNLYFPEEKFKSKLSKIEKKLSKSEINILKKNIYLM